MIDVLKYRYYTAAFSFAIMVSFFGYYSYLRMTRGYAFEYSVDFEGGTQILFKLSESIPASQIRSVLEKEGWSGAVMREFSDREILIRVKEFSSNPRELADRIASVLQKGLGEKVELEVLQSDAVGPSAGEALRLQSLKGLIIGLVLMSLYIAIRSWSFAFSLGALVSLFHDAVVVLALFLFLGREVSVNLVMAVLTLLGYSINDTIVIFARIRENMKIMRGASLHDVVNASINQTLRRTVLMSVATALTVIAMLLWGGESLRDLSLALIVGIVFGTYSSIYMASPVMMLFYKNRKSVA